MIWFRSFLVAVAIVAMVSVFLMLELQSLDEKRAQNIKYGQYHDCVETNYRMTPIEWYEKNHMYPLCEELMP